MEMEMQYVAAGANRHPSCGDWSGEVLAFGSGRNVALWKPHGTNNDGSRGVSRLLVGHTDTVNAVKFHPSSRVLITAAVDKTVRIWSAPSSDVHAFRLLRTLHGHESSVNCIAILPGMPVFATGAADCSLRVWSVERDEALSTIKLQPRFMPLALACTKLAQGRSNDSYLLAVAGTAAVIQLYAWDGPADSKDQSEVEFKLRATLTGHEGWIRSLDFEHETTEGDSDLLLASASQDKYIRLWRVRQGRDLPKIVATGDPSLGAFMPGKSLSNKAHRFTVFNKNYSATFEALLLGHEDWIYSAAWRSRGSTLQLLSASADNSLAIWEQDSASGVWVTIARLGEISAEKGSTTATGSTGGFWTGLWSPDGKTVTCLGRTGSWRLWHHNGSQDRWIPGIGVSGHIQAVTGISWSQDGSYLLSTSADQTTRLHAQWKHHGRKSKTWHEMARPQIHGYDLNCIDSLGTLQFVSGADEKLLRVFSEPKGVADILSELCGIQSTHAGSMASAANMPVLGLSNKAIEAAEEESAANESTDAAPESSSKATLQIEHPPLEDQLSRQTLWPEIEKLYGHGYEISTLAASHDGTVIATACKASSIDHAVIRLFETAKWTEVKPPLSAHTLTTTRLRFSDDDQCLLSVGRDRQWAVFEYKNGVWEKSQADLKGHSRMILDAAWVPGAERRAFATAGRDKVVKTWRRNVGGLFEHKTTIKHDEPVTTVDFLRRFDEDASVYLAVGTEIGRLIVHHISLDDLVVIETYNIEQSFCPSKAITQLSWRPQLSPRDAMTNTNTNGSGTLSLENGSQNHGGDDELAVSSEDFSLRVYSLKALLSASDRDPC